MTIPKLNAQTELTIARAMVAELEDYLKADELYWTISSNNPLGAQMPQLTIGGLLEALAWAEAARADLTPDQAAALPAIRQQHDRLRDDRPVAYGNKATREINSRLDAWSTYLDDVQRKSDHVAADYPQAVRARAKTYLLAQVMGADVPPAAAARLARLDAQLRAVWQSGEFVWDARLQSAFPKEPCWWLYGHVTD